MYYFRNRGKCVNNAEIGGKVLNFESMTKKGHHQKFWRIKTEIFYGKWKSEIFFTDFEKCS